MRWSPISIYIHTHTYNQDCTYDRTVAERAEEERLRQEVDSQTGARCCCTLFIIQRTERRPSSKEINNLSVYRSSSSIDGYTVSVVFLYKRTQKSRTPPVELVDLFKKVTSDWREKRNLNGLSQFSWLHHQLDASFRCYIIVVVIVRKRVNGQTHRSIQTHSS